MVRRMKREQKFWVGLSTMGSLAIAAMVTHMLACSPYPLNPPSESKVDLGLVGTWVEVVEDVEVAEEVDEVEAVEDEAVQDEDVVIKLPNTKRVKTHQFLPIDEHQYLMISRHETHNLDTGEIESKDQKKIYVAFISEMDGQRYLNIKSMDASYNPRFQTREQILEMAVPDSKARKDPSLMSPADKARVKIAEQTGMVPKYLFMKMELQDDQLTLQAFDLEGKDGEKVYQNIDSYEDMRKLIKDKPDAFTEPKTFRWRE